MDVMEKLAELQMQAKIGWAKGQFADFLAQTVDKRPTQTASAQ